MDLDFCQQRCQFRPVKLPLTGRWALVGQLFIQGPAETNRFQVRKVIRGQDLPLDDREIDLHLIQPTGVDWGMDHHAAGVDLTQPVLGGFATRRRALVHNPEQARRGMIRFLPQYLVHQPAKGLDAGGRFPPPHHVPPPDVPGRQVLQRATARILKLDPLGPGWGRPQAGVTPEAGLDARLLVGPEHVVLGAQRLALPGARRQVQKRSGLLRKQRVPWEDPVLVPPGLDGIGGQDPPHGAPTKRLPQRPLGACRHIGQRLPAQGALGFGHQFAGNRLDHRVVQRGKNGGGALVPAHRGGRHPPWPIAASSGGPNQGVNPPAQPPPHATGGAVRAAEAPSWRVGGAGT